MIHSQESKNRQIISFEQACRTAGLKITHQRMLIFHELVLSPDHPTAETVYKRIREKIPTISLDTVYRTLATFEKHSLINRVDTGESLGRFEAASVYHHHIICSRCKEIIDFEWETIEQTTLPDKLNDWGRIDIKKVTVYGVCSKCSG